MTIKIKDPADPTGLNYLYLDEVTLFDGDGNRIGVASPLPVNATLLDSSGNVIGTVQSPISADGDSLYAKDIWVAESDMGDFSGDVTDLVDNLHSVSSNDTSDNPKEIFIHFNRTIVSNAIGIGAFGGGDFSNVEIKILTSGEVETQVVDESGSDTKYTSRTFQLPVTPGFNGIKFIFHTADAVDISNVVILKTIGVISRGQAVKPDGTVIDLNATQGGNQKFSLEELENAISSNNNTQLNITIYDSAGNEIDTHEQADGDWHLGVEASLTAKQTPERNVHIAPTSALMTATAVRLVGTNFDGTTKDPNFWTEAVAGSGAVTQDGEIQLDTGATANSSASYETNNKARFVVGSALFFQGLFKFVTAGIVDNVRRAGAYTDDDGFFFELDGEVFSVGWRMGGSDTLVNSGSFNGNLGATWAPGTTEYYKLDIEWTPNAVFFYINNVLLHKYSNGHLTGALSLPIKFENVNDNGSTSEVTFDCLASAITRLGELETEAKFEYLSGAGTTILKYGAGNIHSIINNDNAGSLIAYDNTAGSGKIIASIDLSKVLGTLSFNAPFSLGLTIVTVGIGAKITAVYE